MLRYCSNASIFIDLSQYHVTIFIKTYNWYVQYFDYDVNVGVLF